MADESQDLFGKIDAILGKRAGFAGPRSEPEDDFPVLTEVVSDGDRIASSIAADVMSEPRAVEIGETTAGGLTETEIDRLAAALEARLSELFIRQQMRVESLIRRVVREELERK